MTDAERYDALVDEIDRRREQIDDLNDEVELLREQVFMLRKDISDYEGFARWVAWWVFAHQNDINLFPEFACRKLNKLGIVQSIDDGDDWLFDWDDEEEWFKERYE